MVNLKINLLPWRQKRRDRLQREFLNGLAAVGLVAVFLLVGAWRIYEAAIDTQKARVAFIASEIEGLDARIAEIRVLLKKRKELLDRMRVIQELQGNRPVSVRLFDELARQLSRNVFFERLTLRGADICGDRCRGRQQPDLGSASSLRSILMVYRGQCNQYQRVSSGRP